VTLNAFPWCDDANLILFFLEGIFHLFILNQEHNILM